MKVRIKKLHENAVVPQYGKPGDAGMDMTATSVDIVNEGEYGYIEYGTGLSIEIPEGFVGLIFPRSSISNTGLIMSNSVGVIDSGYRGEIKNRYKYVAGSKRYEVGDRVSQIVIIPFPSIEFEVSEELSETVRGESGYGSTGN